MTLYLVLFLSVGVLLIALAVPLVRRRVAPNRFYGLRVPATFADESVWYEANARSGRDLAILGIVGIASALVLSALPVSETVYAVANAAVLLVGTIGCAVLGCIRASALLLQKQRQRREGAT